MCKVLNRYKLTAASAILHQFLPQIHKVGREGLVHHLLVAFIVEPVEPAPEPGMSCRVALPMVQRFQSQKSASNGLYTGSH